MAIERTVEDQERFSADMARIGKLLSARDAAKLALWTELVAALSAIADAHDHLWAVVNDEDECGHHYRAVQNDQSCERASALLAEARKLQ